MEAEKRENTSPNFGREAAIRAFRRCVHGSVLIVRKERKERQRYDVFQHRRGCLSLASLSVVGCRSLVVSSVKDDSK